MKHIMSISALGSLIALSGCAPVLFMGGATTVATSASEERGFQGAFSDTEIKTKIQFQWHQHKPELVNKIDVVVHQGRVLLTGIVDKPQSQIEAIRLAWKVHGIKEIIDETTIGEGESFTDYVKDSWISTQLKSGLLGDDDIRSLNYNIQTIGGIIYLMGIAQSKQELDKVIDHARHINGVKRVTSYVTIKSQKNMAPQQTPASDPTGNQPPQNGNNTFPSSDSPVEQIPLTDQPIRTEAPAANDMIESQPLDAPNTGSSFQ